MNNRSESSAKQSQLPLKAALAFERHGKVGQTTRCFHGRRLRCKSGLQPIPFGAQQSHLPSNKNDTSFYDHERARSQLCKKM